MAGFKPGTHTWLARLYETMSPSLLHNSEWHESILIKQQKPVRLEFFTSRYVRLFALSDIIYSNYLRPIFSLGLRISHVDLSRHIQNHFTCLNYSSSGPTFKHKYNMIFEGNRQFYWPDTDASSPRRSRGLLAGICVGPIKMPIRRKKSYYYYYCHLFTKSWISIIICPHVGYIISLHVYAETNHLAKHHSSLFFRQVSTGIVSQ